MSAVSDPSTWVAQHGDALFRYALMKMRDESQAEDMVQETFLAALKARENFSGNSSEKTWLIGILKHKIIDHFRKHKREQSSDDIESLSEQLDQQFDHTGQVHSDAQLAGAGAGTRRQRVLEGLFCLHLAPARPPRRPIHPARGQRALERRDL
jgi:RNA polymerase sigma factor (sigma-70 family)